MSYSFTLKSLNKTAIFLLTLLILSYFIYHTINGNRGIIKLLQVEDELREKRQVLANLKMEEVVLENHIKLIQEKHYDLDYVDELARDYFGLIAEGEKVVILKEDKRHNRDKLPNNKK